MSRRRYISSDISLDEAVDAVAQVSDFAALLYTWMIPHAADDATITGNPARVLALVMPYRRDKTPDDIADALTLIESVGLFDYWDREGGVIYFEPRSFYRYQTYIKEPNRRSTLPDAANQRKSAENAASLSLSLSPSLPKDKTLQPLSFKKAVENSIPESVMGYWLAKTGKEAPTDADLTSLRVLCKKYPAGVVTTAIGQAATQGEVADNFALITTICKAEVAR